MTPRQGIPGGVTLARLTAGVVDGAHDDPSRQRLYWRGDGRVYGVGLGGAAGTEGVRGHAGPDRREARWQVPAGGELDTGTWMSAAPVGWWRELLGINTVRLVVRGIGRMTVWAADPGDAGRGPRSIHVADVSGDYTVELPIAGDAAWCWISFAAPAASRGGAGDAADGELLGVEWQTVGAARQAASPAVSAGTGAAARDGDEPPRVSVVVPTFRREEDAVAQVERLLGAAYDGVVSRVILVDQARTVRWSGHATEVFDRSGERLVLLEQGNVGGSGGYARGMVESLRFADDAVLVLDDDAVVEPEALRRMVILQWLARRSGTKLILGTPLLSAEAPSRLQALAERVDRRAFQWGAADGLAHQPGRQGTGAWAGVDVGESSPVDWDFATPAADADYSGWWGTLLPPGAVAEIGLPAPYFLKWDDAEYGLRAGRSGYRTATVPGTAVWHPTWAAKGTIASWAAWPLHRNRLATAAAYRAGRGVLVDSLVHQAKHVLSLQYLTAELWNAAIEEFVSGPQWLDDAWRHSRDQAQRLIEASAASGRMDRLTLPRGPAGRVMAREPASLPVVVWRALRAAAGPVRPAPGRPTMRHVATAAPGSYTWRTGLGQDAVILDAAAGDRTDDAAGAGTGAAAGTGAGSGADDAGAKSAADDAPRGRGAPEVLLRDPVRARAALARAVRLHLAAARRWHSLQRRYAAALPLSRSMEAWHRHFSR